MIIISGTLIGTYISLKNINHIKFLQEYISFITDLKTQIKYTQKPIFQILERPEIPDMKSGPSRGKLCIIITFAAGFFSVFIAFALNAWKNIKNDPEAMEKLQLK